MNTVLSVTPARAGFPRVLLPLFLLLAGLLPASLSAQTVNHRPTVGWLASVRAVPGAAVPTRTFSVADPETAPASLLVSATSSNPTLLPESAITLGGSGGSRTIAMTPATGMTGVATVTLTVVDGGGKSSATSFTLTVASAAGANTPPVIQGIANETLGAGASYGPMPLVIADNQSAENTLALTKESSNPTLVPVGNIVFSGQNWGRIVTVTPAPGQTGRATITLGVSDGVNTSATSFVLDVVADSTIPAVIDLPTYVAPVLGSAPAPVAFTVADAGTAAADLLLSASSSDESLVPSSGIVFGGTGANRTVTVTPTPGAVGAAMLTLAVSDGDITRRFKLLHVVREPATPFNRGRGVFILDSAGGTNYTTTFGRAIALRDANILDRPFATGFTLRVAWDDVESSTVPGSYDFHIIANALAKLPTGMRLSIIITPDEPGYIAALPGVATWTDAGLTRAVPWDTTLRQRRRALLEAMAAFVVDGVPLAQHPALHLLDPYLPGGFTGIRNPNSTPIRNVPGYTRQLYLDAVQDELRALQDNFPEKFVQIGFFPVTDNENASYGGTVAWQWIRQQLAAEFNGVIRPRIGFFVESLAAWRVGPDIDPFTGTPPVASTLAPLVAARHDAWTGLQMLGNWSRPFNDKHIDNTINGTPADAIQYAYNVCGGQYFEVYITDIENPLFRAGLQSWHDFVDGIAVPDVPVNLTATPAAAGQIDLSWKVVPDVVAYEVQRQVDGGAFSTIYMGASPTYADTDVSAGHTYAYRVRSISATAGSDWSATQSRILPLVTLTQLTQAYTGSPLPVSVATYPSGLAVQVTYDGTAAPPIYPGSYAVVATIESPDYTGSASATLVVMTTALVRHAPVLNGGIDGSIHLLSGETTTLNGGAWISSDLLVPGTPGLRLNGHPLHGGTVDAGGATTPSDYTVTLNGNAVLRQLVRRVTPVAMPTVEAPPEPTGTASVTLNGSSQSVGNWVTLRHLTLNGNAGQVVVPPGTYGNFTINSGSSLVLGVPGDFEPAIYNFQALTLNGHSRLDVVGPVVLTLASGTDTNGPMGDRAHPEWLTIRVANGGLTLNASADVSGSVIAPSGTVTLNGDSTLLGGIAADRLVVNGDGLLEEPGILP